MGSSSSTTIAKFLGRLICMTYSGRAWSSVSDDPMQLTPPDARTATVLTQGAGATSPALALRWSAFRALEWASDLRNRRRSTASLRTNPPPHFGVGEKSTWIFVSTIGELNA